MTRTECTHGILFTTPCKACAREALDNLPAPSSPPEPIAVAEGNVLESPCQHSYSYLRNIQERIRGPVLSTWKRTDTFFCTKCLHHEERVTRVESKEHPPWWNG
jgi:hypothetical protein